MNDTSPGGIASSVAEGADAGLSPGTLSWIERTMGGEVLSVVRQGRWRIHYFMDVRVNGAVIPLILREARGAAENAHSGFIVHFDNRHEAAILAAIQDKGIAVPRFYGIDPDSRAILMERVPGSPDLSTATEAEQRSVMRAYIDNLARLHALDIDSATLPASAVPQDERTRRLGLPLVFQINDYLALRDGLRPDPLLDFAIWWLEENAPPLPNLRLVQGDTGPGQLMAQDGKLVALIDWEQGHLGDPHYDLAVIRMRNMLYPVGGGLPCIADYEEITGKPIDWAVLQYHTISGLTQSPLGLVYSVQQPDTAMESMVPRFGWFVTLRRGLCDALSEVYGISIEPPELPGEEDAEGGDRMARYLAEHLEQMCMPCVDSEIGRYQMRGAIGIAHTLERQVRHKASLDADTLRDMALVLGEDVPDIEQGLTALQALVRSDPVARARDLVWLFARMEQRLEYLWTPMMIAQHSLPLERITEPGPIYRPGQGEQP